MKKMLFVYNPMSGKGQIRFSLSRIIEKFSGADYDVTVYPTKAAMDAAQTVCARAGEFDIIVCCGGDGTLDEVVTGLMESATGRPVGYIPCGSTNDFASSIGIPRQMEQAADTILGGRPFTCDLGRFNEKDYFVYVAAFGLLTDVSYQTKQELKNVLGHAAYIIEGVKRLGSWRSYRIAFESEEFTGSGDFIYGMVTNSNSVGGIKGLPGKNVALNDGLFEVMLVRTPSDLIDWQKTISALLTGEENGDCVIRFKTRRLLVRSEEPLAWTRDGEDGGEHLQVELENMHQVFDIMTNISEASETGKLTADPDALDEAFPEIAAADTSADPDDVSETEPDDFRDDVDSVPRPHTHTDNPDDAVNAPDTDPVDSSGAGVPSAKAAAPLRESVMRERELLAEFVRMMTEAMPEPR
ncbi:MAG: YegS/Rv2252/BmrU family lipid kinase [Clostridiales bacterium]|nr:YegS/Rv2252/BmrU family lipid kinase [Clostridiales bacterium]